MTSVPGSADLWLAMQANIFPRTFKVGIPYVVDSSTSGRVSPNFLTRSKPVFAVADARRGRVRGDGF